MKLLCWLLGHDFQKSEEKTDFPELMRMIYTCRRCPECVTHYEFPLRGA